MASIIPQLLAKKDVLSWLVGLGVWFSLRVREVPGSNPGRALPTFTETEWWLMTCGKISVMAQCYSSEGTWFLLNVKGPTSVCDVNLSITKALLWLVGLGVWFSLRVREVPGLNPGRALWYFFLPVILSTSKVLVQEHSQVIGQHARYWLSVNAWCLVNWEWNHFNQTRVFIASA